MTIEDLKMLITNKINWLKQHKLYVESTGDIPTLLELAQELQENEFTLSKLNTL